MNSEYTNRICGVHWSIAFGVPLLILIVVAFLICGCTYNRNAPLFSNQIELNDSANGNTVPLVGP